MKRQITNSERVFRVILFMLIWLGIPHLLATYTEESGLYAATLVMWIPAWFIVDYIFNLE